MDSKNDPSAQSDLAQKLANRQTGSRGDDSVADVAIVSIFGRGNWLAMELAALGWKVMMVDVSSRMGSWDAVEAEGPFGLFESTDLLASQKARFQIEGESKEVANGFVLWLPTGPVEFRGDMTGFQLERLRANGASTGAEKYVRYSGLPGRDYDRERRSLLKQPYSEIWLAHFAHHFASQRNSENHLAMESIVPTPLFAPLSVRVATAEGNKKALNACAKVQVTLRSPASVRDARVSNRMVDAIEIEDERSGVARARSFVWMLSGIETEKLGNRIRDVLFPHGIIEPEWFWARFRIKLEGRFHTDQIPQYAVLVDDVCLPWSHANCAVLRRAGDSPNEADVWVRLPYWARSDREYWMDMSQQITRLISVRLPQSNPSVVRPVFDALLNNQAKNQESGPPLHPIFAAQALEHLRPLKASNLFFDGPEHGDSLDALGGFRRQRHLLRQLDRLKEQWDEAARKAAAAAAAQAAVSQNSGRGGGGVSP
jgi:hypothetical protein